MLFRADLLFEICHVFTDRVVTLLEADTLVFHRLLFEELHELAAKDLLDQLLRLAGDGFLTFLLHLLDFSVIEISGDGGLSKVQNLCSKVVDCQVVGESADQWMQWLVWISR